MKITRTTVEEFDFDLEAERARLREYFKGQQLRRQLAILNAMFADRDLELARRLYDKLPWCPRDECSEKEFVGLWISVFTGSDWGLKPVSWDVAYRW